MRMVCKECGSYCYEDDQICKLCKMEAKAGKKFERSNGKLPTTTLDNFDQIQAGDALAITDTGKVVKSSCCTGSMVGYAVRDSNPDTGRVETVFYNPSFIACSGVMPNVCRMPDSPLSASTGWFEC